MNILVTSVGSYSASSVISRLALEHDFRTFFCNSEILPEYSSAHFELISHSTNKLQYLTDITEICKKNSIDVIIPLTDPEIDILNHQRIVFNDLRIVNLIPNSEFIRVSRNKRLITEIFRKHPKIRTIPLIDSKTVDSDNLPAIAKPINGRSSEGVFIAKSPADLRKLKSLNPEQYIIQPFIDGNIWVADIMKKEKSDMIIGCRKELTRTGNGRGITVDIKKNPEIEQQCRLISEELNFEGVANIEFIESKDTTYVMDINPRFSAGIQHTQGSGIDIIGSCINKFIKNQKNEFN